MAGVLLLLLLVAGAARAQDVAPSVIAGIEAYNGGDIAAAFRLLKAAADRGDSDAQVNLGYLYARGHGVQENQQEAMRLYLLSAKQGNAEGMNAVGFKFRYGTGVAIDLPRAVHWFCRAATLGDPRGLNNLGIMYFEGQGVEHDLAEARRLWSQSAERGNPNAMANLGQSLLSTEPLDREQAMALLVEAAKRGHGGAQAYVRRVGYQGALPAPIGTSLDMRPAQKDLRAGKVRDCGVLVS